MKYNADSTRDTAQAEVRRIYGVQIRPLLGGRAMIHLVLHHIKDALSVRTAETVTVLARHAVGKAETADFTLDRHPNLLLCLSAGAGRFRPPLTVARKFRLCLHPDGVLRVQSLHLPREGLGSAFSVCAVSLCMIIVKGTAGVEDEISLRERNLMRNSETCLLSVCRVAAEQSSAVCRHGGGLVKHLEEMSPEDWNWTMGLYEVLLEAIAQYCDCKAKRQEGRCALTGLECEEVEEI